MNGHATQSVYDDAKSAAARAPHCSKPITAPGNPRGAWQKNPGTQASAASPLVLPRLQRGTLCVSIRAVPQPQYESAHPEIDRHNSMEAFMGRHASSPSGPGKPTAEKTSAIKEQEGLIESASESDQTGTVEGEGKAADHAATKHRPNIHATLETRNRRSTGRAYGSVDRLCGRGGRPSRSDGGALPRALPAFGTHIRRWTKPPSPDSRCAECAGIPVRHSPLPVACPVRGRLRKRKIKHVSGGRTSPGGRLGEVANDRLLALQFANPNLAD
jgi:hypothetical protein